MAHGYSKGIPLKKGYGQHFLRDAAIPQVMVHNVKLNATSSVFEIGCGDGFLTRVILQQPLARLWVFEIDPDWANYVRNALHNERLTVNEQNILDLDFSIFEPHKPWILLANLPYAVTFPILRLLKNNRHLLQEGVIMIQEEVAEKILKTSGRGYGFPSLFFQRFFTWKKLDKIAPSAFYPPPKIYSRLLHFTPILEVEPIENEVEFWKFIKICFRQPRRTLRNNLAQSHHDWSKVPEEQLALRAQQMSMRDFMNLWKIMGPQPTTPDVDLDVDSEAD